MPYQIGRKDSTICQGAEGDVTEPRLPSAEGGLGEIARVFADQLGLTLAEAGAGCMDAAVPSYTDVLAHSYTLIYSYNDIYPPLPHPLPASPAVTLFGAHSVGHVHLENSGYSFATNGSTLDPDLLNAWDDTPAALDNDYYIKLTDKVRPLLHAQLTVQAPLAALLSPPLLLLLLVLLS